MTTLTSQDYMYISNSIFLQLGAIFKVNLHSLIANEPNKGKSECHEFEGEDLFWPLERIRNASCRCGFVFFSCLAL